MQTKSMSEQMKIKPIGLRETKQELMIYGEPPSYNAHNLTMRI